MPRKYKNKEIKSCKQCGHISNDGVSCRHISIRCRPENERLAGEPIPNFCPLELSVEEPSDDTKTF